MELTWEQAKEQIDQYIISYFFKIEWYYGDNRAPFAYPAQFYIKQGNTPVYICELVMEYPGAENIIIKGKTPALLIDQVIKSINSHFTSFEKNQDIE